MRKIPFAGIELTSQRVRGYEVPLSYRGDRLSGTLKSKYIIHLDLGKTRTRLDLLSIPESGGGDVEMLGLL